MLTFNEPPPGWGHDIASSSWRPRPLCDPVENLFAIAAIKLRATPLGIRKLDLGANGGRILFTAQPNLDPMTIIKFIQTQPRT